MKLRKASWCQLVATTGERINAKVVNGSDGFAELLDMDKLTRFEAPIIQEQGQAFAIVDGKRFHIIHADSQETLTKRSLGRPRK